MEVQQKTTRRIIKDASKAARRIELRRRSAGKKPIYKVVKAAEGYYVQLAIAECSALISSAKLWKALPQRNSAPMSWLCKRIGPEQQPSALNMNYKLWPVNLPQ